MTENLLDLAGRVAFVTGASSRGIGSGIAKTLAAYGAQVFLVARREENLKKQVADIEMDGGIAAYAVADVAQEAEVKAAVEACVERFGRLDILICAAGICGMYTEDVYFDTDDWRKVMGANLDGVYYAVQYAYPHLKQSGNASIVPVLSMAALKVAGCLPYTATKGALLRMVPWMAKNMGPEGIRVNGIAPGIIDTDMTNPPGWDTTEFVLQPAAAKAPLRRCATIEDCANTVLFLVSDMGGAITGQIVAVDCGEAMIE